MIQDQYLSIDNFNLHSNMSCSQRIVSSNHDTSMGRVVEITDSRDGIRLERTVEDEETSEFEITLDFLSGNTVHLMSKWSE